MFKTKFVNLHVVQRVCYVFKKIYRRVFRKMSKIKKSKEKCLFCRSHFVFSYLWGIFFAKQASGSVEGTQTEFKVLSFLHFTARKFVHRPLVFFFLFFLKEKVNCRKYWRRQSKVLRNKLCSYYNVGAVKKDVRGSIPDW